MLNTTKPGKVPLKPRSVISKSLNHVHVYARVHPSIYIDIYTCMQLPFSSSAASVRSSLCGSLTGWAATCWKSRQQRLPDPWYGLDILGCTWIPSEIGTSTASNLANNQEEIQSGNLTLQPLHIF